jgi:hypothetical protein
MGLYIDYLINGQQLPQRGKAEFLLRNLDGVELIKETPCKFEKNLVCVVQNTHFDAALVVEDQNELDYVNRIHIQGHDNRRRTFLIVPDAEMLARFKKTKSEGRLH